MTEESCFADSFLLQLTQILQVLLLLMGGVVWLIHLTHWVSNLCPSQIKGKEK